MKKRSQLSTGVKRLGPRPRLQAGAAPGTLVPVAGSTSATVTVLRFAGGTIGQPLAISDFCKLPCADTDPGSCTWVRVCGLGEIEPLLAITEFYGIRSLALEDILSPGWRTKVEEYDDYLFFVLQGPPNFQEGLKGDHFSLFCKKGLIITFETEPTTTITGLWQRLRVTAPSARLKNKAAYLTYAVLDYLVDHFFPILDAKDDALATLEELLDHAMPGKPELATLHHIKRDLLTLRRVYVPYKEIGSWIKQHRPTEWLEIAPFMNDLSDHIIQVGELIDSFHEVGQTLDDIYQSSMSNRMNDIIKVLTLISTIFMPLSFLAGVYGMNFEVMPELKHPYGYPGILGLMAAIFVSMLAFFKYKKWL